MDFTRYRSAPFTRFATVEGNDLFYSHATGEKFVVRRSLAELLEYARNGCTLDGLLARLPKTSPDENAHSILSQIIEKGFLIPDSYRAIRSESSQLNRIKCLAIATRNRPSLLKRALSSYLDNFKIRNRSVETFVADDSDLPETLCSNQHILGDLAARYGSEIWYAGRSEKSTFIQTLAKTGVAATDILEFMLFDTIGCSRSVGANTNAILLHCVGDVLLKPDDDTVCKTVSPPDGTILGTSVESRFSPWQVWWFKNREAALEFAEGEDCDLLGLHESLLGRELSDIAEDSEGLVLRPMNNSFAAMLATSPSRVITTMPGLIGDSAIGSLSGLLLARGSTRSRLVGLEAEYKIMISSREVLQSALQKTVTDSEFCMGYGLGLDNRVLLPPFFPILRDTDGIFGATTRKIFGRELFGHLPCAQVHDPTETRAYQADHIWRDAEKFTTGEIVKMCIRSCPLEGVNYDAARRLRFLGNYLVELGNLNQKEFKEFCELRLLHSEANRISLYSMILTEFSGQPAFWADDVRRFIDLLQRSVVEPGHFAPDDLGDRSDDEKWQLVQCLVMKFGKLLMCWPDIIQLTKHARERGQRFGSPVQLRN